MIVNRRMVAKSAHRPAALSADVSVRRHTGSVHQSIDVPADGWGQVKAANEICRPQNCREHLPRQSPRSRHRPVAWGVLRSSEREFPA